MDFLLHFFQHKALALYTLGTGSEFLGNRPVSKTSLRERAGKRYIPSASFSFFSSSHSAFQMKGEIKCTQLFSLPPFQGSQGAGCPFFPLGLSTDLNFQRCSWCDLFHSLRPLSLLQLLSCRQAGEQEQSVKTPRAEYFSLAIEFPSQEGMEETGASPLLHQAPNHNHKN